MKWTNKRLMLLTYLAAPLFPFWLLAEAFLSWRDERWDYEQD